MNKKPFFSFLVPNYGYNKFIFDCFDSLVNQKTSKDYDYEILVCDQSDLETFEKIKKETEERYGDRINLFHSDIKGLLRARHTLIRKAIGEYCLCVDSDDFVDNDYLFVIYENLKKHNFPDILIHNFIKCDENGKDDPSLYTPFICEDKYLMDYFLYSNYFNEAVRKTFKRSLYVVDDSVDMESVICEDWILSFPLMTKAKSIVYVPEIQKYHYRMNSSSLTHTVKFERAMKNLAVHDQYLSKLAPNNLQKKIFDSQIAMTYVALGDMLIRDKTLTSKQFKVFCNNARDHLYDIDINDTELYEMSKNHKTIYKLLKNNSYWRLKWIFRIRKLLH